MENKDTWKFEVEQSSHLAEILMAVEADKAMGHEGCTIEELEQYLETIIEIVSMKLQ